MGKEHDQILEYSINVIFLIFVFSLFVHTKNKMFDKFNKKSNAFDGHNNLYL
jgi:hypothetical protein